MFKSYLMVAVRSALRDKLGSLINLAGLITGFAIFTFGFAFARYEQSYDSFFEAADRIAIPATTLPENAPMEIKIFFATFFGLGPAAKEQVADVEEAAHLITEEEVLRIGEDRFRREVRFTEPAFFNIFPLEFSYGDADSFETRTDTALLSERGAINLFGNVNAIGQTFELNDGTTIEVAGIFKNLPLNSHFSNDPNAQTGFDLLLNKKLYERIRGVVLETNWNSISSNVQQYLLLREGYSKAFVEEQLTEVLRSNSGERMRRFADGIALRELTKMNLNQWDREGIPGLLIAQGVGLLILGIAVMNSISLNTARLIGRSREIALRRVVGARRRDLTAQFLSESIAMSFLALLLTIPLVYLITPTVGQALDRQLDFGMMLDGGLALFLVASALLVALLSTSYPIYLLSGASHNMSLTRTMNLAHSAAWLRKALAALQFALVSALILSVVVVTQQITHIIDQQPKFDSERTVIVSGFPSEKAETIRNSMSELPGLELMSLTSSPPFSGNVSISMFNTYDDSREPSALQLFMVDDNYLEMFGIELLAGRALNSARGEDVITEEEWNDEGEGSANVMVSERTVRELGFASPMEAIGQNIRQDRQDGFKRLTIVGVLPNMNVGSPDGEQRPAIYMQQIWNYQALALKLRNASDIDIEAINTTWQDIDPTDPVRVNVLADSQNQFLAEYFEVRDGFAALATIAIILASAGLYGLAAFLAAGARREMGIRKVLGARTDQITRHMMIQFSKPVVVALAVGLPLGYYVMQMYLEYFPDRISVGSTLLGAAAGVTLAIAWITVAIHAIRAARTHPAEVLRYE